jgi:hypothetical protein
MGGNTRVGMLYGLVDVAVGNCRGLWLFAGDWALKGSWLWELQWQLTVFVVSELLVAHHDGPLM